MHSLIFIRTLLSISQHKQRSLIAIILRGKRLAYYSNPSSVIITMPWSFQLYFALLIAAFCKTAKATKVTEMVSSSSNGTTLNGFRDQGFKCVWRCEVDKSDLYNRIKTAFNEGKILINLRFDCLKKVDKKCAHEILRNSSEEGTFKSWSLSYTDWQIWLVNNKLPLSAYNAIGTFGSWVGASANFWNIPMKANCSFTLPAKSTTSPKINGERTFPRDHLKKVLRATAGSLGKLCNTDVELSDQQTCIEIGESTWINTLTTMFIGFLFMTIFPYIGLAVVCLFSATEDTHEGIRQINVEGPSPVGFRSLIGNYFFSTDHTMWHMARKFIMRVFILPIPFLVPAIFVEYLLYQTAMSPKTNVNEITHLFQPFRLVCYGCYCIQAFYFHFIIGKANCTSSCVSEWNSESKHLKFIWTCWHQELPQRMSTLLRVVWEFSVFFWSSLLELKRFPSYQDMKNTKNKIVSYCMASCEISVSCFLRFLGVIWIIILVGMFIFHVPLAVLGIYLLMFPPLSSPIATLCTSANFGLWQIVNFNFLHRNLLFAVRFVVVLFDICMSCLAAIGVLSVLKYAAVGIVIFLQLAVSFVLSKENLPFLTCCVLICCYLWNSYRSFTQKYQDLALKLFEQHDQLTDSAIPTCNTDLNTQGFTFDYGRTIDNVKRIPKDLFDVACEELMPIGKGICTMVLKATLSVIFVWTAYSFTMLLDVSPVTKTLLTLLAGAFPKIVTIYTERRRKRNSKQLPIDEKARAIVHEYMSNPCNQVKKSFFVFTKIDEVRDDVCHFPAFLIISITTYLSFWNFFQG